MDDLIFFRNDHNSKIHIQGVIRVAAAEKFNHLTDWGLCPATIRLQGTSVPEQFSKYTIVLDVINNIV